ncbi:DUF1801 domain-containing protein [Ekhidna sp.]|uniref:DUF1801 domain-containing protein n=1 Tax=Ekhidna sp. TaxID=2608089 RepID=UPI003CCB8570
MKTVENFILGLDGSQKAIVSILHQRLTEYHDLIPKIRFNIPMYYRKTWVCYLNPIKNDGIELAFLNGCNLSNDQGLLKSKDRKMVSGIELFDISAIPEKSIDEIVQEALILDDLSKTKHK